MIKLDNKKSVKKRKLPKVKNNTKIDKTEKIYMERHQPPSYDRKKQ